jgi:HD-GYP domain-containing protein (c-di-GMP phosphodiesterase class II)
MTNKITVSTLQIGMTFTEDVYIDGNSLFVPANVAIRKKDIDMLTSLGIQTVETEGFPAGATAPDDEPVAAKAPPPVKKPAITADDQIAAAVNKKLANWIAQLAVIFGDIAARRPARVHSLYSITSALLQIIRETPTVTIRFILGETTDGEDMAKQAIDTAILSILMAYEMALPEPKIVETAVGALLHDVGMLRLTPMVQNKKEKLTADERHLMETHTLHSFHIIHAELGYPEAVGYIALHHHEHWDGTGYPGRIAGRAIEVAARIIAAADAFEAMVVRKPYRDAMLAYEAMKTLISENAHCFSPDVLDAFVKIFGIYPVGSNVILSDGRPAKVIKAQQNAPLRPIVKILLGKTGMAAGKTDVIDLLNQNALYITRAMGSA